MSVIDMYEMYFVKDIRNPKGTGVRLTAAYREQRRVERFWCQMQILVLNVRLRRRKQ